MGVGVGRHGAHHPLRTLPEEMSTRADGIAAMSSQKVLRASPLGRTLYSSFQTSW
jgi:hypothetical protein